MPARLTAAITAIWGRRRAKIYLLAPGGKGRRCSDYAALDANRAVV